MKVFQRFASHSGREGSLSIARFEGDEFAIPIPDPVFIECQFGHGHPYLAVLILIEGFLFRFDFHVR